MGMQAQPVEMEMPGQKSKGTGRSIAPVARHRMAGQLGMPPDLMLSAGRGPALDERKMVAVLA